MLAKLIEFKEITIHYEAITNNGLALLYTDYPDGTTSLRVSLVLSTGGRKAETFPLDGIKAILYNWEFRPGISPQPVGDLAIYGGSFEARVTGLFMRGAKGEKWTPQPIAIGA